jgi:hypothetical protein
VVAFPELLTIIVEPGRGTPLSSVTVPEIDCCAKVNAANIRNKDVII